LDTASSIFYKVHKTGEGYKAVRGTEVDMHFRGVTLDGKEFVNTFSGLPERVYLGATLQNASSNPMSYTWGLDEWLFRNNREGDSLTVYLLPGMDLKIRATPMWDQTLRSYTMSNLKM
jgi:hypothetical protein